jgi:ABC-type transport system substrate-binding protein
VLAGMLALSVGPTAAGGASDAVRLTVGVIGPIGSIDVTTGTSDAAREVWKLQYPTLTAYALDDLTTIPGLAEGWTAMEDGRGFVYTLRPTTWSDGSPVTAGDVVTSLERARDERWPYAEGRFDRLHARAIDDRTVEVTTTGALGALPTLPLHVVPAEGDASRSAGDFRVVEATDDQVRMGVVDRPGRPALDEVVFRSYRNAEALARVLDSGVVDIAAGFDAADLDHVRAIDKASALHANDGDQWILQLRVQDASVRNAVARAIDRDALVLAAVGGVGRPQVAPVVARSADWQLDADELQAATEAQAFAPEGARSLLARARVTGPLTIATPDDEVGRAISDAVVRSLRKVGLLVERAPRASGIPADLTVARRDVTDDPTGVLAQYTCAGDIWCDADYDAAYGRFATSANTAVRQEAAHAAVERLIEGVPEVVLFAPDELQAYRTDDITGIQRRPEDERLVVFWPSVGQYRQMVAAAPAASEEVPNSTFAVLVVAAAVVTGVAVFAADRVVTRRRAQGRRNTDTANALPASNG